MRPVTTARRAASAALAAGLLVLGTAPGGAAARRADTVMTCLITMKMSVGGVVGDAHGNGSVRCSSFSRPDLVGGNLTMQGTFSISGSTVTTQTTDTITFPSTGDTITLTVNRTFENNFGQVNESGSGNTTAGVFHPARESETGSGTAAGGGTSFVFDLNPVNMALEK